VTEKREFIVEIRNKGRTLFGIPVKQKLDDERLTGDLTVNYEVYLSDPIGMKGEKFKVTIERVDAHEPENTGTA